MPGGKIRSKEQTRQQQRPPFAAIGRGAAQPRRSEQQQEGQRQRQSPEGRRHWPDIRQPHQHWAERQDEIRQDERRKGKARDIFPHVGG